MQPTCSISLILIVDDEPSGRRALESLLLGQGYGLAFACNGAEGLSIARRLEPNLIVLDVMMPENHGLEYLSQYVPTPGWRNPGHPRHRLGRPVITAGGPRGRG